MPTVKLPSIVYTSLDVTVTTLATISGANVSYVCYDSVNSLVYVLDNGNSRVYVYDMMDSSTSFIDGDGGKSL